MAVITTEFVGDGDALDIYLRRDVAPFVDDDLVPIATWRLELCGAGDILLVDLTGPQLRRLMSLLAEL